MIQLCCRGLSAAVLYLTLICLGHPAALADGKPLTDEMRLAKAHFIRGAAFYETGQYLLAHDEFAEAYRLSRLSDMLFNLARTEEKLDRLDEAIEHLEAYLLAPQVPDRDQVRANLDALRARRDQRGTGQPSPRPVPVVSKPAPEPTRPVPVAGLGGERTRPRPMAIAKWSVGAAGLVGVVIGAVLLGLDGHQDCGLAPRQCPYELDTRGAGIALLSLGLAGVGTSAVLFGVDYRRGTQGTHAALMLGGVF